MRSAALLASGAVLLAGCSGSGAPAAQPGATRPPAVPSAPADIAGVQTTGGLGNEHREGPLRYEQTPPVGGPHNPQWLRCSVYDAPVPAEFAVHSLEHGAVWVTYRPGLPAADVARLAALHELGDVSREYVIVSPYDGLTAPVVAVAWGSALPVESAGDARLEAFVRRYAGGGQGGEPGAPCTSSPRALTPEQARAALGTRTS